jgi:CRP-like cAMP-binding protein
MTEPVQAPRLVSVLLESLGDVLHALQRERGCASLYLVSSGPPFREWLDRQYLDSDLHVSRLMTVLEGTALSDHLDQKIKVKLYGLKSHLDNLANERDHTHDYTRGNNLRHNQVINRYTFYYIILISDLMIEIAQSEPGFDNDQVAAYSRLLQWKERMGRERTIGSRGFAANAFRNPEFCDRMYALLAEQHSFMQTLMSAANEEQRRILEELCQSEDYLRIEHIHRLIEEEVRSEELDQVSAEEWFELLTRLIDQLRIVEQRFLRTLWCDEQVHRASDVPWNEATASGNSGVNSLAGVNQGYKSFLKSLPIFSHLSDLEINALLVEARIREFEKGRLLFLQGEPTTRLYVIVKGWIKLFNGSEGGEETVLQMLSAGDTMLESAVILDMPAPMNAQVVEEAIILSVPAPVIRQHLNDNNGFAVNMLTNMSLRSQRLILQVEQSRLHTAKERVGWFLLQAYLGAGGEGTLVQFPYDKALAASFLDMRPETLSRTLKKFKEDGFSIVQDSIQLPDTCALCGFCDTELAGQCARYGSEECPGTDESDGEEVCMPKVVSEPA